MSSSPIVERLFWVCTCARSALTGSLMPVRDWRQMPSSLELEPQPCHLAPQLLVVYSFSIPAPPIHGRMPTPRSARRGEISHQWPPCTRGAKRPAQQPR
eukprot:scaffold26856_cov140-Isochrysis_galbana.AAC.2